jgi:hypothetical protein
MATINAPTLYSATLAASQVATVAASPRGSALVQVFTAGGLLADQALLGTGQSQRFGPYTVDMTVKVRADDGVFTYTTGSASDAAIAAQMAALQASQDFTWQGHIDAGNGTFDGQRRRIIGGVGNVAFWLEWEAATSKWWPVGGQQLFNVNAVVTDTNSTGSQSVAATSVTTPANFFRDGLGFLAEVVAETSISATARTLSIQLDATDNVVGPLPAAGNRRIAGRFGFVADSSSSGYTITKADGSEYDFAQSANSNLSAITRTWSNAVAITCTATFTTAASAATAKLRRCRYWLVRG